MFKYSSHLNVALIYFFIIPNCYKRLYSNRPAMVVSLQDGAQLPPCSGTHTLPRYARIGLCAQQHTAEAMLSLPRLVLSQALARIDLSVRKIKVAKS